MATTTNYGWTTPDDTALVKDGASAIRTLGSSVDTTVKALSPGTTAGDVDYYTSATAKARLAIGTTGQVLTVAGGVPSWATSASGGMTLLSTTALTGASTVVSGISGSYNELYILVNGLYPSTNSVKLNIKPNATASTASYSSINNNFGTFASATVYRGDITSNYDMANTSATLNTIGLRISNYANTTYAKNYTMNHWYRSYSVGSGHDNQEYQVGGLDIAAAITSLTFSFASGNIAAGSCLIYGVK
jgi:hypothetical protein